VPSKDRAIGSSCDFSRAAGRIAESATSGVSSA
jgi:hypothetical protein